MDSKNSDVTYTVIIVKCNDACMHTVLEWVFNEAFKFHQTMTGYEIVSRQAICNCILFDHHIVLNRSSPEKRFSVDYQQHTDLIADCSKM